MKALMLSFILLVAVPLSGCVHDGGKEGKDRGEVHLVIEGQPGVSTWEDRSTVSVQLRLKNEGEHEAHGVRIDRVSVEGGNYVGPAVLPFALGNLRPDKDAVIDIVLGSLITDGRMHTLTMDGEYTHPKKDKAHRFRVSTSIKPNATPPGPFEGRPGQAVRQKPESANYPKPPAPPAKRDEEPAESPIFIPLGPARQLFIPTPTGTQIRAIAAGAAVEIPRNTRLTNAGVPPDPNAAAASADGVVLVTYNAGISVSTDGGQNFTDINLFNPQPGNPARTSFFPQSDGGLCCDQVVVYLPNQNLFVWLLQYQPVTNCTAGPPPTCSITQPNRVRIAWASPAAIAANMWNAWTYADLTGVSVAGVSDGLGVATNEWLDYPDLAWSNSFLYVGVDHGFPTPGLVYTGRRIVARLSLADIANPSSTVVHYDRAELTGSNGLNKTHFVQNAPGRMVVGSLDNSSTLSVFTWNDNAGSIPSSTVIISQIQQGANYTSIAPDGSDWIAVSFPGNITGATYRNLVLLGGNREEYVFAFDAGTNRGGGRPQAYVRLETLTPSGGNNYQAFAEYDIWNNNYAFAMTALGTSATSELGITLAVGGGTLGYPQHAVGYKDDFVVYTVTGSNATQISRFGDYLGTRPISGNALLCGTAVYDVLLNPLPPGVSTGTCTTVGCRANMRFVQFGRPQGPEPPIR